MKHKKKSLPTKVIEKLILEISEKHNIPLNKNTVEFISKEIATIYSEDYQAIRRRVNRYFEENIYLRKTEINNN
jgi:hypothetical protein